MGKEFGYEFDPEIMLRMAGTAPELIACAMMEKAGMDTSRVAEVIAAKKEITFAYNRLSTLRPVFEIVKAFKGKKPMAIGTGTPENLVNLFDEMFNLSQYVDVIITGSQVTQHKPHPETYSLCVQALGVPPEQCLVFEDGELGMLAANAAGIDVYNVVTFEYRRVNREGVKEVGEVGEAREGDARGVGNTREAYNSEHAEKVAESKKNTVIAEIEAIAKRAKRAKGAEQAKGTEKSKGTENAKGTENTKST